MAIVEVPVSERATASPVSWSGLWVGALTATTATLIGSLLAVAFRAYDVRPGGSIGPEDLGITELAASVCIALFSFVIGGWAAAEIAGFRRAEPAMLHGAMTWLRGASSVHGTAGWRGRRSGPPRRRARPPGARPPRS